MSCSNSTNLPYSSLGRSQHLHLKGDGYLLGFEKVKRSEAALVRSASHDTIVRFPSRLEGVDEARKYRKYFEQEIIDESRLLLATQVARFDAGRVRFLHNAYGDHPRSRGVGLTEGASWSALNHFRGDLRGKLASGRYTHILVMCMGWNNDQHDAVFRYNTLVENIGAARPGGRFKPLVIGITWPSVWLSRTDSEALQQTGHLLSYFNKSDDADELGIVYLNWLLHRAIPDAQPRRKVPVVAVGHSFGARAMSRAVHSRDYLISAHPEEEPVDLFVGLQAAVSVNRYLPGRSLLRGSAYAEFPLERTLLVYTSSMHDKANRMSRFVTLARNMGSKHGAESARRSPLLDYVAVTAHPPVLPGRPRPGKPLVVDATSFVKKGDRDSVRYAEGPGQEVKVGFEEVTPHNDILDLEMGYFLRSCLDLVR